MPTDTTTTETTKTTENTRECRLLLVEDRKVWFRTLNLMLDVNLEKRPFTITWVQDGEDVLDALKEMPPFDGILMNIEMPGMDGITATYEVRKAGYTMPIVAWSSHPAWYKAKACEEAGMNGYIERNQRDPWNDMRDTLHDCKIIDKTKLQEKKRDPNARRPRRF